MAYVQRCLCVIIVLAQLLIINSRQPNIVFILADDMGYEDAGFRDSDILTPNLDKLAREGVILQNHYVMPICGPSRASMLTGRYGINNGFWQGNVGPGAEWGLGLNETTISEMLQGYGYSTHIVGKWHAGTCSWDYTPVKRGFDTFMGIYLGGGDYFTHISDQTEALDCRSDYIDPSGTLVDTIERNLTGQYSTDIYTQRAVDIIEDYGGSEKPLFLYLAYTAPHVPLEIPDSAQKYTEHMTNSSIIRKTYAAMISVMDRGVGEVMRALERTGIRDNTVVVFNSDNGANTEPRMGGAGSNYPLRSGKGSYYEGGVRGLSFVNTPLLSITGYTNKHLHHITDWFPTFEHLASQDGKIKPCHSKPRLPLDGLDIWDSISQNISRRDEVLIGMSDHKMFINVSYSDDEFFDNDKKETYPTDYSALRYRQWKILMGEIKDTGWSAHRMEDMKDLYTEKISGLAVQLYDLENDPREKEDVACLYPEVVKDLLKRLERYSVVRVVRARSSVKGDVDGVWYPWLDTVDAYPVVIN